jgi:hypothetical protein
MGDLKKGELCPVTTKKIAVPPVVNELAASLPKRLLSAPALEHHYSIPQIAKMWCLSVDCVRAIFRDVPGVLKITRPETRFKRGYVTLRVPESVLLRVHATLRKAA